MYTGRTFRLKESILGIETVDEQRTAVMVPAGETVLVLSGPRPDDQRLVDVAWGDRYLVMFATDLDSRSQQILRQSAEVRSDRPVSQ